jgi:hypothetical protein
MHTRQILGKAAQVITYLFAMFGGFLKNVAPPQGEGKFAVGLASALALLLLLLFTAFARGRSSHRRRAWLAVAVVLALLALASGLFYRSRHDDLTFVYPPGGSERYIGGAEMRPLARAYQQAHDTSASQTVEDSGGLENIDKVWARDAIERATTLLVSSYLVLVLTLAGSLFCLTEMLLSGSGGGGKPPKRKPHRKPSPSGRPGGRPPGPPQIRTCGFPASGSSARGLATGWLAE